MYSYIPYLALVASNAGLIIFLSLHQKKHTASSSSQATGTRKSSVNITVISITLLFVVLTFPSSVISIYFDKLFTVEWGFVVIFSGEFLQYTYYALSFPVLMISNKRFREKFCAILTKIGILRSGQRQQRAAVTNSTSANTANINRN